jgi:hypothetical protein
MPIREVRKAIEGEMMRIRNNNDFVLLLTLILGVLVAFYGRTYLGEYLGVDLWSQAHLQDASSFHGTLDVPGI